MKRLLLFVHYDRDGMVDDHILYLLSALVPFRQEAVVIANSPVTEADESRLLKVADRVVRRENRGFDFGAWGDLIGEYEFRLEQEFDSLLLVNGTCFGPLFPLQEMFDAMADKEADFWGVTQYTGTSSMPEHLQSYFMEIRKPMLTSAEFRKFFREVGEKCVDFAHAVRLGEAGFSQTMLKAGFKYRSYIEMNDLREARNVGICEAFSHNCAANLIEKYRLPLVKVKAFAQVSHAPVFRGDDIINAIRCSKSAYPEKFIYSFLRRTAPLSWQKNLPGKLLIADRTDEVVLPSKPLKMAVFFHCFYPEMLSFAVEYLKNIPVDFDLLVTAPDDSADKDLQLLPEKLPHLQNIRLLIAENRGRDIAPWLCALPCEEHLQYDVVLKLHLKKTPQMPEIFTDSWMKFLYDNLLGSPALVAAVLENFAVNENIGTVFTPYPPEVTLQCPTAYAGHPDDAAKGKEILRRLHLNPPEESGMPVFGVGTMFYYRPAALEKLFRADWKPEDFPAEPLPWRGTAAHAMERIIPYIIQAQGYDFRQCIHLDQLQSAFRKYENRVICFTPSLKEALKFVKQALVTSLHYRLGRFFRRK